MISQEKTFTGEKEITLINVTDESINVNDHINQDGIIYRNSMEKIGTRSGNKLDLSQYFQKQS